MLLGVLGLSAGPGLSGDCSQPRRKEHDHEVELQLQPPVVAQRFSSGQSRDAHFRALETTLKKASQVVGMLYSIGRR
jgi:hypothetical protein